MALLETAAEYIVGMITKNEEVKKFPEEFINESVKWVKSWFLTPEDPKTMEKLNNPNKSIEYKKDIVEDKLDELKGNAQFQKELNEKLQAYTQHKIKRKGVIENANIDVKGNFRIGDTGNVADDKYDEKGIIKGSTIKAGGDFRLGDDVVSGNQNVQIVHNYFGNNAKVGDKTPPQYASLKSELKALLGKGKTADVISRLLNFTEMNDNDTHNSVLMQSTRLHRVADKEERRIVSESEANVERNQINDSLTKLIDKLEI